MANLDSLTSWHADWSGLKVAVFGLGVTGFSVADTLVELGVVTLVIANKADPQRADLLGVIGAGLVIEADPDSVPAELVELAPDLVVVSPGYRLDHALVAWAESRGIPLWGDIELAWRLRDRSGVTAPWIAVTGTNGKTTTVQLTTHLLVAAGHRAVSVGNIGTPVLDAIRDPEGYAALVVELSSFQLHWLRRSGPGSLEPLASACLNVADDHLDWHGSREAYAEAKATVYANTRVACVYNRDDEATMHMVEEAEVQEGCRAIGFGLGAPGQSDFGMVGDIVLDRAFLPDRNNVALELTTHGELDKVGLAAPHMVANVLAAAALARAFGVSVESVRAGLTTFRVDRHRTEPVVFVDEVLWVDDSKATNSHAADAALSSFESVVWIVGGLLKGTELGPLVDKHAKRLRGVVIIGANRQPVVEAFARHAPMVPVFEVTATETKDVMPEAVRFAVSVAGRGDVVLLAPAAASMDQFTDYADRGNRFAAAVHELTGGTDDHDSPAASLPTAPA